MNIHKLKEESKSCLPLMRLLTSLQQVMSDYDQTDRVLGTKLLLLLREISTKEQTKISRFIQDCHQLTNKQLEADDELQIISSEVRRIEEIQVTLQDDLAFDMASFDPEGNYEIQETSQDIAEQIVPEVIRAVGNNNDSISNACENIIKTVTYLSNNEPATVETIAQQLEVEVIFARVFLDWLEPLGLITRMSDGRFSITQKGYNFQNLKS